MTRMTLWGLPTSPDGTDWGIYGDSPREQWNGMEHEAQLEDAELSLETLDDTKALRDAAYALAMYLLQSDHYANDPSVERNVDTVLHITIGVPRTNRVTI